MQDNHLAERLAVLADHWCVAEPQHFIAELIMIERHLIAPEHILLNANPLNRYLINSPMLSSLKKDPGGVDGFVKAVGSPHQAMWDERTANAKIHVDGDLAMVWVDYTFYLGERKSHCGVDAFQLVKGADGWKVVTLVDTRRRENCPETPKR